MKRNLSRIFKMMLPAIAGLIISESITFNAFGDEFQYHFNYDYIDKTRLVMTEMEFNSYKAELLGEETNYGGDILYEKGANNCRSMVVFLGDSWTAGSQVHEKDAFPALIGKYWKDHGINYEALNAGFSGRDTEGVLSVLDFYLNDKTALIFLEIGWNDVDLKHLPAEDIEKNIQTIISRCREKNVPIALAGITLDPMINSAPSNCYSVNKYLTKFNMIYPDLAKKNGIPVMNFFIKNMYNIGRDYWAGDGRHPSEKGHEILARDILLFLNKNWN